MKVKCLEDSGTGKARFFGKMVLITLDNGSIAMHMVKVNSPSAMERYTKVNGKTEDQMVKAAIRIQIMPFSRVITGTTCSKGLALKRGPMAPITMATTKMARSMAMVCTNGLMAHVLWEIGNMVL